MEVYMGKVEINMTPVIKFSLYDVSVVLYRTLYNGYEHWWVHSEHTGKFISCLSFLHAFRVFDMCTEGLRKMVGLSLPN